MTSEGLGEMFECDSADMCAGKFSLVSMRGRVEGLACADPGARTPIGASGILPYYHFVLQSFWRSLSLYYQLIMISRSRKLPMLKGLKLLPSLPSLKCSVSRGCK